MDDDGLTMDEFETRHQMYTAAAPSAGEVLYPTQTWGSTGNPRELLIRTTEGECKGASEKEPSREPWPRIHILKILSPPSLLFLSLCVCVSATATPRRKKSVAFEESGADKKGPEPENGTQAAMRRIRKQSAVITGMTGFFSGKEEGDEVLSLCPVPYAHTYNRHLLFVPCGNLTLSRCAGVSGPACERDLGGGGGGW